jgi:UDP-glucose/iron transport system ATP-binding protein
MEQPLPLLEACRIGRRDGADGAELLADVSLTLRAGDRLGLAGPSGAGKTVLLRALARLDPLSSGDVFWQGGTVHGHRVPQFRARVMYLHQRPVLVEGSVEANLQLPFQLKQHREHQYDRPRIVAWLNRLDRDESFLAKRQYDLSGGEAQLAGLLRALQLDPQVLLLDEPTAALDRHTATLAEELLSEWLADPTHERAYVWVSHDTQQTERMCERMIRLLSGSLLSDQAPMTKHQ